MKFKKRVIPVKIKEPRLMEMNYYVIKALRVYFPLFCILKSKGKCFLLLLCSLVLENRTGTTFSLFYSSHVILTIHFLNEELYNFNVE